jgi:hypothetical protein
MLVKFKPFTIEPYKAIVTADPHHAVGGGYNVHGFLAAKAGT